MMMQQGIVMCVESPEAETEVALPPTAATTRCVVARRPRPGRRDDRAEEGMLLDDAAALLIKDLLAHIAKPRR